ncbi:hypothetical protein DEU56DRAFT_918344 [Suillus clintonianus]|uniref:uncharacterized protein n=1 Tax=Suillus clintonianus TaxID=1904413 RepID=UPI001B8798EF|nr:uncharacterized protein DEU56DRAFT_918344 [Suillus clintonianus]KAG2121105.1 hypothetical protein DEU56DRAFT_918344 [Suillus clintonianus]
MHETQPTSNDGALKLHHFSSSIFYPEIRQAESENALLQPLLISVWFSGAVPRHLAHSNIPIEITVSLNEEYTLFTVPVIEIASQRTGEPYPSNSSVSSGQYEHYSMSDDAPISFLPLPPTFDYTDSDHWAELSGTIQSWLVAFADTMKPEWTWGRDTFWYAFVAANPDFPGGKWAFWGPSIPLEGQFIEEWVGGGIDLAAGDADEELATPSMHNDTLSFIWTEFSKHVALFYPYPLISTT